VRVLHGKRSHILISPAVHPQYRQTLRTYLSGDSELQVTGDEDSASDLKQLEAMITPQTACVVVQNPDFFGSVYDLTSLAQTVHDAGALLVVVSNPIMALGLLKPPSAYGADIVAAEGQPLGIPLSFGGPYLGVLGSRTEFTRRMPGRIVGQTVDADGRRGFVLTLTPREQHIRREKATSNICTNQSLAALMSGIYLSAMGKKGMRMVAEMCYHKAHFAADEISRLHGYEVLNNGPFFNEFVVQCPKPVNGINEALLERGIIGGHDLQSDYPDRENQMLLCLTEMNTREQISNLVDSLKELTA
jgi:glycine dehydrogenase subunit 1